MINIEGENSPLQIALIVKESNALIKRNLIQQGWPGRLVEARLGNSPLEYTLAAGNAQIKSERCVTLGQFDEARGYRLQAEILRIAARLTSPLPPIPIKRENITFDSSLFPN